MADPVARINDSARRMGRVMRALFGTARLRVVESSPPWRAKVLSREALGDLAIRIAKEHAGHVTRSNNRRLLARYGHNRAILEHVYQRLSEASRNGEALTAGAEWLLDNYHVVERHVVAIKKYLPPGYYRTLPKLDEGEFRGFPRVYHLALEFIVNSDAVVNPDLAAHFLLEYQKSNELRSGEIWAFPIMLRFALLENLCRLTREAGDELLSRRDAFSLVDEILGDESRTGTEIMVDLASRLNERASFFPHGALEMLKRLRARGRKAFLALQFLEEALRERGCEPEELLRAEDHSQASRQISVGNTLTSLTAIDQVDWRAWFEDVSLVHSTLAGDPASIYLKSDFETRDRIRHKIERLSRAINKSEMAIAAIIVSLAEANSKQFPGDESDSLLKRYVGYFTDGHGRAALEKELRFVPGPLLSFSRFLGRRVLVAYLGSIIALTAVLLLYVATIGAIGGGPWILVLLSIVLFALPATEFSSNLVQYLSTKIVSPKPLSKLDFLGPVPAEHKTAVLMHTIFKSAASIEASIDALEVRYLGNDDPAFTFLLMADLPDGRSESLPVDQGIIDAASKGIQRLNDNHPREGSNRFLLFFRKRLWNSSENKWMAWERKRGKLEELNRYVLGERSGTLELHVGSDADLEGIRYILTLDSDSQLPRETAKKLVATIAHPMNHAVFDEKTGRVVDGYGLVQPRVSISLTSATVSAFSQLFSGQAGLDPYTNVVSEVYQDLFGEGSYVGKGIYDVRVFERALKNRVPDNTMLSHDLFEGSFVRAGLASDIELYDDFPSRYMAYAKRLHRWVRGDWQLLPWLLGKAPSRTGFVPNPLSTLARWKILDNLRRSLLPPACFLVLLAGWTFLPGGPLLWTALILLIIAFPVVTGLASVFALPSMGFSLGGFIEGIGRDIWRQMLRTLSAVCFLPHQAVLMVHAIAVTLYRVLISKKNLLEWEPAEQTEKRGKSEQRAFVKLFLPGFFIALAVSAIAAYVQPESIPYAAPFILLWAASPFVNRWISKPIDMDDHRLTPADRKFLFWSAHDIWRFFDDHLTPELHYLVPDNLQLVPKEVVAERTSPTNISLSMLSVLAAHDLGFLSLPAALDRISRTLRTVVALEKYRGHLFNWYGNRTLEPLSPRYISTVDSGNFWGHLFVLDTVLKDITTTPLISRSHASSVIEIGRELIPLLKDASPIRKAIISVVESAERFGSERLVSSLARLIKQRELLEVLQAGDSTLDIRVQDILKSFCTCVRSLIEIDTFFPWAEHLHELDYLKHLPEHETAGTDVRAIVEILKEVDVTLGQLSLDSLTLRRLTILNDKVEAVLAQLSATRTDETTGKVLSILGSTVISARARIGEYERLSTAMHSQILKIVSEMDFTFLYDDFRNLFTIGYNTDHARRDGSFYDLLASEARLPSFIAIARGVVPQKHWFTMGRSLATTKGGRALLSWSGTMFEYLMPLVVMRDYPSTILGRTIRSVIRTQIAYGKKHGVPWGISESAYSGVDFEKTYQYRAFGVPGLGLKRGLSEDLVVSPYSTFLALPFAPSTSDAVKNLLWLESLGARGRYGFFEAIDFTPSRVSPTEAQHVVQAFFAHHQGMSLLSLDNLLNNHVMVERFHEQPMVKATELLLHERFPERIPTIVPHEPEVEARPREAAELADSGLDVVTSPHTVVPRVCVLSNGRYSVMVDNSGGGCSFFDKSTMLTRWREDPTQTSSGSFVYIRDAGSGNTWSTAFQPTRVEPDSYEAIFSPGKIEFKRFDDELFTHTEITVAFEDDVELRRVTVTNLGSRKRSIDLVSYMEPVLATRRADASHPAFGKLFVRSEALPEADAILCSRRKRSHADKELFFFHRVTLRTSFAPVTFRTAREDFIGRGRSMADPVALTDAVSVDSASVDPIASLGVRVEIEAGEAQTVVFISGVAHSRKDAELLINRYQELMHVNRAFELAWSRAQVEARNHAYSAGQVTLFHRLAGTLFYSEPSVRGSRDSISSNRLTQSALWRFGISGDIPMVLLKMNNPKQIKVVQELLLAHHFLRERGVEFDLIVLHHYPGGYLQQLAEELEYVVRSSPAGHLLDRPGGVFLRSTQQISEAEIALLDTVSRVVINAELGGLTELFATPVFEQTFASLPQTIRRVFPAKSELQKNDLQFSNGIGGFSADGRAYVLPRAGSKIPPTPWSNVVANPNFGFLVTDSGSGFTWSENSRENRLTSWSNDPVLDPPSEVVYVRDVDSGEYWSLTPLPAARGGEFEVQHRFGSSTFRTEINDLASELTFVGASEDRVKWYGLTLENSLDEERRIEVYLYIDLVLGVSREDSFRFITTTYDRSAKALCAVNRYNNEFAGRVITAGCSEDISAFTTSRLEFIGRNGDLESPILFEHGGVSSFLFSKPRNVRLSGRTGAGFDPCFVLQVGVTLRAREKKDLAFYLAECRSFDEVRQVAPRFQSLPTLRTEQQRVSLWWAELTNAISVRTPSKAFDILMNGWLLYQTVSCRLNGRSGFYQSGGAIGFRDQLQDSLALLSLRPDVVREQIILHAAHQFREGDVQHWWHPPTGRGVRTRISDDLLWLPYALARYVEVTGDEALIDVEVSFLDGPQLTPQHAETYFTPDRSSEVATILEHCIRAFRATAAVGVHGLPLIGAGDWNDGMNEVGREGKGESVWLAWFQIDVIRRFVPLLESRGVTSYADELRARAESLSKAVEEHGWDGEWYRRAFYDDGTPIGSKDSEECTIDSLAQSWAVMSKGGDPSRASQGMNSAVKHLVDRKARIIKLLTPPFQHGIKNPGYIKGYPPGIRENGGQYTHAATWVVIASAMLGNGSDAVELFDLLNPITHTDTEKGVRTYTTEPYALCGDVYSEGRLAGHAGWSWYTGSSGWLYQAGLEYILGIRIRRDYIELEPCIHAAWPEFQVDIKHHGRIFHVKVENPNSAQHGISQIFVNGTETSGNRVALTESPKNGRVEIRVVLGNG